MPPLQTKNKTMAVGEGVPIPKISVISIHPSAADRRKLYRTCRDRASLQSREDIISKSWLSPLSFSMPRGYYDCKMHFRLLSKQ